MPNRRTVLVGVLLVVAALTAILLGRVLATVFFAVTVAYVLVPFYQWFLDRGLPRSVASAIVTAIAFVTAIALFLPIATVLYLRRVQLLDLLASLPPTVPLEVSGFRYVVDVSQVASLVTAYVTRAAIDIAQATPALLAHATVFGFVVFGLLVGRHRVRRALFLPVPEDLHDVPQALHERARGTLFALYVIQAVTSLATFAIATVLFWALGYETPFTLGVFAGILQFLPVVGPSVLVVAIAAYEASIGAVGAAALVLVLGLTLVGFAPDALLRPRLARETASLPASLYFVGFTGGILTLGPVGVIAGPLVVALLAESVALLARDADPVGDAGPMEEAPE